MLDVFCTYKTCFLQTGRGPCGFPKMQFEEGFIRVLLAKFAPKKGSARGQGLRKNLCGGRPGRDPCGPPKMQFEAGVIGALGKKGSQKGVRPGPGPEDPDSRELHPLGSPKVFCTYRKQFIYYNCFHVRARECSFNNQINGFC